MKKMKVRLKTPSQRKIRRIDTRRVNPLTVRFLEETLSEAKRGEVVQYCMAKLYNDGVTTNEITNLHTCDDGKKIIGELAYLISDINARIASRDSYSFLNEWIEG